VIPLSEEQLRDAGLPAVVARVLFGGGYWRVGEVAGATEEALLRVPGIGPARLAAVRAAVPYCAGAEVVDPADVTFVVAEVRVWEDPLVVRRWEERSGGSQGAGGAER
jgi:hypothetical protein